MHEQVQWRAWPAVLHQVRVALVVSVHWLNVQLFRHCRHLCCREVGREALAEESQAFVYSDGLGVLPTAGSVQLGLLSVTGSVGRCVP
jgi:hypothetical protein